jgi:uncharacterized protein
MTTFDVLIIVLGALAGGFVSGLAGFGTALTTVGIWLHALDPMTAATLTLVCSVVGQLQTIPSIWREINPGRVLPFIVPGLLGVPLGLWLLTYVDLQLFKLGVGLFLVSFATFMLAWRGGAAVAWGGRWADGTIGLLGGVLGGLAGLSGALPTIWASLRGWSKDQKRSMFQVFNLTILTAALAAHAMAGRVTEALAVPIALALPGTLVGAWLGFRVYLKLSERNFGDLVMALLFLSGILLLFSLR